MTIQDPVGDDATLKQRVSAYLQKMTGFEVEVGALRRFPVGFSWRTYLVPVRNLSGDGAARDLILRLGPDYGLFAPYSAMPEWLAMKSLEDSAVPVPRAYWAGDDANVFGAPFLFCERIDGAAVVPWVPAGTPPLDEAYRRMLGEQFIDALAALHRVPWQTRPIAEMGHDITVENAARINVEFWEKQIARWAMRPYPAAEWAIHRPWRLPDRKLS